MIIRSKRGPVGFEFVDAFVRILFEEHDGGTVDDTEVGGGVFVGGAVGIFAERDV